MRTKECIECRKNLLLSEFSKKGKNKYLKSYCKKCQQKRTRDWRITNPSKNEKKQLRAILNRYSITEKEYNKLFKKQEGKCAICGTHQKYLNQKLGIDHSHKTGQIRGLLCSSCNRGLGFFKDDFELLQIASEYLKHGTD